MRYWRRPALRVSVICFYACVTLTRLLKMFLDAAFSKACDADANELREGVTSEGTRRLCSFPYMEYPILLKCRRILLFLAASTSVFATNVSARGPHSPVVGRGARPLEVKAISHTQVQPV